MDDQLDDDLKNHIREVFENYEDTSADEGWLLLREKYPQKAKRRPAVWLWWGSAAALLLLFIGVLWFKQTPVIRQHLALNKKQQTDSLLLKTAESKKDNGIKNNIKKDSAVSARENQQLPDNTVRSGTTPKTTPYKTNKQQSALLASNKHPAITGHNIPGKNIASKESTAASQGKTQDQNIVIAKNNNYTKADTGSKSPVKSLAVAATPPGINMMEQMKKSKINDHSKVDTSSKPPAKLMATTPPGVDMEKQVKEANKTLFADDDTPNKKKSEKPENTDKAVRFGVYAATYFNYAKGSNSQLNVGAGVTSDIKLSNNIKLSTGVTIAQNTLNYATQPTLDAPASPTQTTFSYILAPANVRSIVTPTVRNYNADLVGLDVPVNIKYEFNPQKSSTYISLGLSSGTFINETYNYSYSYPTAFSSNSVQPPDQSTHESFNSFYFAKTLNFSFGTGYSLGRNKLIIEPFLKYPLEGLGSQQIRFGAGGLNLKFSFDK